MTFEVSIAPMFQELKCHSLDSKPKLLKFLIHFHLFLKFQVAPLPLLPYTQALILCFSSVVLVQFLVLFRFKTH